MATVNRKWAGGIAAILFAFAAIAVAVNSNSVLPYIAVAWNGRHVEWNGIDVKINDREYFPSLSPNGQVLFIGDWQYKTINLALHAGSRSSLTQRAFVSDFCRPGECSQVDEKTYLVEGHAVIEFTFEKIHADKTTTYHQYILVDRSEAWLEYFGEKAQYPVHKLTIDSLVLKLAQKK